MIESLKDDDIITKVGGRFKLTALIQRRLVELMQGARPMVETRGLTEMEVVVKEIMEGKIEPVLAEETAEAEEDVFDV
jgi:DNA-directed RNA polymerase subunit omega